METIEKFSDRLAALLHKRQISQKNLCEQTGITRSWMSCLVRGSSAPRYDDVTAIADALGMVGDDRRDMYISGAMTGLDERFRPYLEIYEQLQARRATAHRGMAGQC